MNKKTAVHKIGEDNTINNPIVHKTESPYQVLLRRKAELLKQKEDKEQLKK